MHRVPCRELISIHSQHFIAADTLEMQSAAKSSCQKMRLVDRIWPLHPFLGLPLAIIIDFFCSGI